MPELKNLELFSKEIWCSYFIINKNLFKDLLHEYKEGKKEIENIVESAKKEETDWKKVIELYNSRFFVPFEIYVENQPDVILKSIAPIIKFNFKLNKGEQLKCAGKGVRLAIATGLAALSCAALFEFFVATANTR